MEYIREILKRAALEPLPVQSLEGSMILAQLTLFLTPLYRGDNIYTHNATTDDDV
jgi:hypothetical protein